MNISYVIVTDGQDVDKTRLTLKSIHYQYRQPTKHEFEIILCGAPVDALSAQITRTLPMTEAAKNGLVGALRNAGADQAQYDTIAFLDDDIILNYDWLRQMLKFNNNVNSNWQVLGGRLYNIDGTRFWDRCTMPPNHRMVPYTLPANTEMYQTSGLLYVKRETFKQVRWAEQARVHSTEPEDLLFSKALHAHGVTLDFNERALAWHNDAKYTADGNVVVTRLEGVQPCDQFIANLRVIDR